MPHENLTGRTVAGYRLIERIGEGGTATVYRAEHPERGTAAVKILRERMRNDQTAVQRFLREAGYGQRVQHPAVVKTYDFGETDGLHYLALEWASGEPLADYVNRCGRLDTELVAHIVSQLASGLSAAHAQGIIHRDLKPENMMFDPETRDVKLLDFGIARDAQLDASERLTRTGFFVGTLNYVAPEALSGALVGEAADTYSLATIAYYLLTGRHPYTGRSPRELFQQLLSEPPTPLSEAVPGVRFPRGVEAAIMEALSREPENRPTPISAFADRLAAAANEDPSVEAESSDEAGGLLRKVRGIFGGKRRDNG